MAETHTAPVNACRACGSDLKHIDPTDHERRVQVDIVFETREVTVEAEIKTCPRCRARTRGRFPNDMPGPLQYGHGVVAFATHLLTAQRLSLQRAAQTLETLTGCIKELPEQPRQNGQRGRIAKSDAENLHEALVQHETAVLRFACHPDVPFTNNRAERGIRMTKVKQKIAGCFRTAHYAAVYCRLSSYGYSYLQSMAQQGYNSLTAINIALNGNAAMMIEKSTQNNPDKHNQDEGASSYPALLFEPGALASTEKQYARETQAGRVE